VALAVLYAAVMKTPMSKRKKAALAIAGLIVAAPAALMASVRLRPLRTSPVWSGSVEATPERLARGRYLAEHVAVCADCHSERDWSTFSGPPIRGTLGGGGEVFGHAIGFPGEVTSRNITPHPTDGVGGWSDGELVRAVREGVNRQGRPLAPIMPYANYAAMGDEDARAIVVWARSLPALARRHPEPALDFPLSLLVRTMPAPAGAHADGRVPTPAPRVDAAYGAYLVRLASCADCHTPSERGEPIAGREFAGGQEFRLPGYVLRSANITPDATGIGAMSEDAFVARFRSYRVPDAEVAVPRPAQRTFMQGNTIMPWRMYAGMTDDDLRAIYRYLRTLRPVSNVVPRG
jgi:mono/diheme cytochrome c family protein